MIENLNQSITIISEKMAEKKEMAKLLDKQIQISSDLLKEKLTSELEHLDLLRSRQGIKAELTELKGTSSQLIQKFRMQVTNNCAEKRI